MERFIIADDFPLSLMGTQVMLEKLGYEVLSTHHNGSSAWEAIKENVPDYVILDINMPVLDGIQVSENIRLSQLPIKIILLTSHKEKSIFNKAMQFNVNAYLLKQFALDELSICLKTLANHDFYISPHLNSELETDKQHIKNEALAKLTFIERKVFELVVEQKSTKEIAALLFLSEKTIESHRSEIIRKLEIESGKNALLKFAAQFREI